MNVSGKVRVNACSFVLVGSESVVAWSKDWGGGGGLQLECGVVLCYY
jgi:hypothetical protein